VISRQPSADAVDAMNARANARARTLDLDANGIEVQRVLRAHDRATAAATGRVSIAQVWRDALSVFSARSASILFCALIGFAMPTTIGAWIDMQSKLSNYARTRSVVVLNDPTPSLSALFTGAVIGVVAMTFARGVITWMTLHTGQYSEDGGNCGGFGRAVGMTLTRYPALLFGSLFYGAIVTAGLIGMSELTRPLEYSRSHTAHVWAGVARNFSDVLHQLSWRSFNTLTPAPGPPFAQLAPDVRRAAQRDLFEASSKTIYVAAESGSAYGVERAPESFMAPQTPSTASWLLASGSLVFLLLAETLLHFRTVMAMKPPASLVASPCGKDVPRPRRLTVLAPLIDSVRFGLRHFGAITLHIWLVRLAIFALIVSFIEFPLAMIDNLLAPYARLGSSEVLPIMEFLETSGAALVSAILLAFSVVYDARLARRLERG
jgi:hypothetical protein